MWGKKRQKNGASERIRTVDSHVGNVILYQLSYTRLFLIVPLRYHRFEKMQIKILKILKKILF